MMSSVAIVGSYNQDFIWRTDSFWRHAYSANTVMMTLGFVLIGYQLTGYFVS